ncbi:MAG: hypothetical protein RLZ12_823 [Bacillota bacterium]|jgi:hypothetical protein
MGLTVLNSSTVFATLDTNQSITILNNCCTSQISNNINCPYRAVYTIITVRASSSTGTQDTIFAEILLDGNPVTLDCAETGIFPIRGGESKAIAISTFFDQVLLTNLPQNPPFSVFFSTAVGLCPS